MAAPPKPDVIYEQFKNNQQFGRFARQFLDNVRKSQHHRGDISQFIAFAAARVKRSESQLFQDLWALWESQEKRGGYFVEFGAANGKKLSNTYALEKYWGWQGIVAEPNPDFHDLLEENRSCTISTKCVFSRSGEYIPFLPAVMGELSRIKEIVPDDMQERAGKREQLTRGEVLVETISLNDLLSSLNAPETIDFMSVDTEGSEFEILSNLDFDRWKFNAICVEHNHTSMRAKIHDLMTANGYRRKWEFFSAFDDWYVPGPK